MIKTSRSKALQEYWEDVAKNSVDARYSWFGLFLAPYWKLQLRLVMELLLRFLPPVPEDRKWLLLKTDLWDEGIDSSSWQIYELLGDNKVSFEVVGIDISPITCRLAETRMHTERLMIACTDARKLPFRDNTYDAILDASTLDHIPPDDVANVISEYERILKGGGTLVLIFDSVTFRWVRYLRKIFNRLRSKEDTGYGFWWQLSPVSIKAKLSAAGFAVLDELPLGILTVSPLFLKTLYGSHKVRFAHRFLQTMGTVIRFTSISKYLFPLSTQYLIFSRKLRDNAETGS